MISPRFPHYLRISSALFPHYIRIISALFPHSFPRISPRSPDIPIVYSLSPHCLFMCLHCFRHCFIIWLSFSCHHPRTLRLATFPDKMTQLSALGCLIPGRKHTRADETRVLCLTQRARWIRAETATENGLEKTQREPSRATLN